ncbi:GntR family transcriptional regulator [Corynebacterium freiburgense]|uniref:GntR family transcriptional regulator n=1 Tax=Corynebacterium freiburgense TaxID=556548 RepID=UPI00040EA614|nr:GntR family transcriptional regulator [Corynebacterium freiburgense]WJZ02200.1 putative HTH-type transcriptional regulator YdfH [Corynebacterium freiburgense]
MGKATVEQLVRLLSNRIHMGELRPGTQLAEIALASQMGVSRNTLREAFRLLARDGLVEHLPNRGVFVRTITEDCDDIYAFRRFVELGALDHVHRDPHITAQCLYSMKNACDEAERAGARGDWAKAGAANTDFHQAIVDLVGCERLSEQTRIVLTQARLLFLSQADWKAVHKPFIEGNRSILAALQRDDVEHARLLLSDYLFRSKQLVGECR